MKCKNCNNEEFDLQDGLYFCQECGIQFEANYEMELDEHQATKQSKRKIVMRTQDSEGSISRRSRSLKGKKLTSWEEYNHILIGLVDEILQIEKVPNFKKTVLQLWISYLRKSEAAFFSKQSTEGPKLHATYRDADAHILYNKKLPQKKKRIRVKKKRKLEELETAREKRRFVKKSEKLISKQLSESAMSESFNSSSFLSNLTLENIISEHEDDEIEIEFSKTARKVKKRVKNDGEVKVGVVHFDRIEKVEIVSSRTLLMILGCALNISKSKIQISDLIRFVNEGNISFYNMSKFLPEDYIELGIKFSYNSVHHANNIIFDHTFRRELAFFTQYIPDLKESIEMPDLNQLIMRYVSELNLPNDIAKFAQNLIKFNPPKMKFRICFPNYEGRAMAFILFILKLLFGIDGCREIEMSESVEKLNKLCDKKIFNYEKWREFIEYRKRILEKFYFPTLLSPDYDGIEPHEAYNNMFETLEPTSFRPQPQSATRDKRENRYKKRANILDLTNTLINIHNAADNRHHRHKKYSFETSMTPLKDNFKLIIDHEKDLYINRALAEMDFTHHSMEEYLRPEEFQIELMKKNVDIEIKPSKFPKVFDIGHYVRRFESKKNMKLYLLELTKEKKKSWTKRMKDELETEKEMEAEKEKWYKSAAMKKNLECRQFWRQKIQNVLLANDMKESTFYYDKIEDIDIDKDEIINQDESEQSEKLTFIKPDYNMWRCNINYDEHLTHIKESDLDDLPESFSWLLNTAAQVMHQHPMNLYRQLLIIEYQYMFHLLPIELINDILYTQSLKTKRPEKICKNQIKDW